MKNNKLPYFVITASLVVLAACSTRKDKFVNREFQALNTKYNVLFHGNNALNDGINDLAINQKDNFWEVLPVEKMQPPTENLLPGESKNANFNRAEEKATKAIQKRSMNIGGRERNSQMDEAYLLLGKSRYYDGRFVPALEAFNYILYKNPDSDKIYDARIWREKTNMRMENDALAAKNLGNLLKEIKIKGQTFSDANAILAEAYYHLGENNQSIHCLKNAIAFTEKNPDKARYRFILGQMYEKIGKKDSSYTAFKSVIDMKHRSPRVYIVHAQGHLAGQFDYKKGDTLAFVKNYQKLLKDRENRPYLDVLNHQLALYYDEKNSNNAAKKYYNKSLKAKSDDQYLRASNYRNLGQIHFDQAKYVLAGKYYDSTLVSLEPRTREYNQVKRKRENLEDVIKYESIAHINDSILNILSLSDENRKKYYETHIAKLKTDDAAKAAKLKKAEAQAQAQANAGAMGTDNAQPGFAPPGMNAVAAAPGMKSGAGSFYFYSPSAVTSGKQDFKNKWGKRQLVENWRLSMLATAASTNQEEETPEALAEKEKAKEKEKAVKPEYTTDFYVQKLPTDTTEIATLTKDRNFAYYQLGLIYKEKFNELKLAADKLERLLQYNPEERLVLPSMYHLYKIYEIIDKQKALAMKDKIISQYPDSRYASILSQASSGSSVSGGVPEKVYSTLYELYEGGEYFKVLDESSKAISDFTGEEIVPKLELLHANVIGKLKGVEEYKNALNFVALNYPNSPEGKEAELIIKNNIPVFEAMQFSKKESASWKILYELPKADEAKAKVLEGKIKKFVQNRTVDGIKYSLDIYTMDEYLMVIHGIHSEIEAKDFVSILADYKDFRVSEPAIIISTDNYKVVQVKKNLKDYLEFAKPVPVKEEAVPGVPPTQAPAQDKLPEKVIPGAMLPPAQKAPQPQPGTQGNPVQNNVPGKTVPPTNVAPAQKTPQQQPGTQVNPTQNNVPGKVVPPTTTVPPVQKVPAQLQSVPQGNPTTNQQPIQQGTKATTSETKTQSVPAPSAPAIPAIPAPKTSKP